MKKKLLEGKNKIQGKNSDRLFRLKTSFLPKKMKRENRRVSLFGDFLTNKATMNKVTIEREILR